MDSKVTITIEIEEFFNETKDLYKKLENGGIIKIKDIFDPEAELSITDMKLNGLTDKGREPKHAHIIRNFEEGGAFKFKMIGRTMKRIDLKIDNCGNCPYCRHERWLYSFICTKSNKMICPTKDLSESLPIPDFCELDDK